MEVNANGVRNRTIRPAGRLDGLRRTPPRAVRAARRRPIVTSLQRRIDARRTARSLPRATFMSRRFGGYGWRHQAMTYEERVVREEDPAPVYDRGSSVVERRVTRTTPSGGELASRIVILLFGIVQVFIILRIVLLLLNAREGNDLVSFILNTSQIFVAPFNGILNVDNLKSGGSIFDIAAVLALVGWSVLEALILAAVGVFRREPAV